MQQLRKDLISHHWQVTCAQPQGRCLTCCWPTGINL